MDKVSPLVLHPASWILPSTEVEVEASLEINSQRTATCLAHAFVFLEGLPSAHRYINRGGIWWCAVIRKTRRKTS